MNMIGLANVLWLSNLPPEIIDNIVLHLPIKYVSRLRQCCQYLYNCIDIKTIVKRRKHKISTESYHDGSNTPIYMQYSVLEGIKHGKCWGYSVYNYNILLECKYINGLLDGECNKYNSDGKIKYSLLFYKHKLIKLIIYNYHSITNISHTQSFDYVYGEIGIVYIFCNNKLHCKSKYNTSKTHTNGSITTSYPDGKPYTIIEYENNQYHGKYIEYRRKTNKVNHSIAVRCSYQYGLKHGFYLEFDSNYNKRVIYRYVYGIKI